MQLLLAFLVSTFSLRLIRLIKITLHINLRSQFIYQIYKMLTDKRIGVFYMVQGPFLQQRLLYSITLNELN